MGLGGRPVIAQLSEAEKNFIKKNSSKLLDKKILSILNRIRSAANLPLLNMRGLHYFQKCNGLVKRQEHKHRYKPNKWY